ncbi:AAA family ATPase [Pedobacter sp. MC2016-24]|uniref:AAA family ATPase n=1 Tax=Pedobacter sp. MC2016-24 TaxID=2780090 RepID=UPI00187EA78B|nr:AAA family ATPase [Pedobacter sp. MC2016-24]MBE9602783.1 AAA family ATPase [Pedobacter sp. MC2016-24]
MFKSLKINTWRQYEEIDINFHPRLTILTGANGAGKTTLLNLLNQHFGWPTQLIGTPKKDKKTGGLKFFSDFWKILTDFEKDINGQQNIQNSIGQITYENGGICSLSVPTNVGSVYNVSLHPQQGIKGLHIPSHRPIYKYQPIHNISTQAVSKTTAFNLYNQTKVQRYQGGHTQHTENYYIKEALISLATFGYGNEVVSKNDEAINIFEGFQQILKKVLPLKLGFEKIAIRIPEVILVTKSGEFALDAVSGGIASIIDLAWQIYMFDDTVDKYVVTFDEPENHLHPEMQKTLLPNFLAAFPNAQFIIASHNPFIISSVPDSNVYVLNYNQNNRVESLLLENIEKSGSANDILREVLGIETTMPDWVDAKIEAIISRYSEIGITTENLSAFKSELKTVGLEKYVSTSVADLLEKSKKND